MRAASFACQRSQNPAKPRTSKSTADANVKPKALHESRDCKALGKYARRKSAYDKEEKMRASMCAHNAARSAAAGVY